MELFKIKKEITALISCGGEQLLTFSFFKDVFARLMFVMEI